MLYADDYIKKKIKSKIISVSDIVNFTTFKKEPQDDEAVYISEHDRIDLTPDPIKEKVVKNFNAIY